MGKPRHDASRAADGNRAPGQAAFDQTVGTLQNGLGVSHAQALTLVDRMVNTQAFTMSAVDVFYGSAVIFLLLTGLVWFARPKSAKAGGGGGGSGGGSPLDPASRLGGHQE